ncbi:MAG: hypothetical protein ACE5GS_06820 [Kiloniellaceae bacterium]
MTRPTHSDLHAEIAALRAVTEAELKNLNVRLSQVEATQNELVRVATQGRTGLRVALWLGGFLTAALTALAAFWKDVSGR